MCSVHTVFKNNSRCGVAKIAPMPKFKIQDCIDAKIKEKIDDANIAN